MANKLTRMDIVREAREWINTPFKHQGALKGVACDCIGLIKAIGMQHKLMDYDPNSTEALAGVEPAKPSLQQTRTVKGGQAATAATAGLGVVEVVQQTIDPARDALIGLTPYLEFAKWLLLVVTLIGIGVMLWARIDDHRKGLR